jgi:alanyl-tRNA synthetase
MEYLKEGDSLKPLEKHNVDFGGGLERISTLIQGVDNIYEIDIYKPILKKVKELTKELPDNTDSIEDNNNIGLEEKLRSERIITDHIKASTLIIMDGVVPSSNQQGYILRRLIRRSVRHARKLGVRQPFTEEIAKSAIQQFSEIYPDLKKKEDDIVNIIVKEEEKFNNTLENGLEELENFLEKKGEINGEDAFKLYETHGLPVEVTEEILQEKNTTLKNRDDFFKAQKEHKEKSRSASKGLFKGGLADTSEMSVKYHTATHLLLAALRKVLGDHIYQMGSNITPERLRLDFPSDSKLTPEQIKQVEDIVNDTIEKELEVSYEEKNKEEALKIIKQESSSASFIEKYGDVVKVYYVGPKENPFSTEICNGPHVENTGELSQLKIIKQENVGAGVKRIKAILQ